MRKFIDIKIHYLFQSYYIRLQSVMSSITISTSSSLKKKKRRAKEKERMKRRRRKRKRWKRGEEEKGMERVYKEGREKGRMRCGKKDEKEGEEERRGRERRIKNRKDGIKSVPPPLDVFPSVKLGNNMTPIKGRLGKNTTPTNRSPTKPKQNLQVDPMRRRSSLEASSRARLIYTP